MCSQEPNIHFPLKYVKNKMQPYTYSLSLLHTYKDKHTPDHFLLVNMWSELVHNIPIKTPEQVLTSGKQ